MIELLLWNRKERQSTNGHVLFEPVKVSWGAEIYAKLKMK